MYTLAEVAGYLGLTFSGDAHLTLTGLASLVSAGPQDLSYHRDHRHLAQLRATRAAAVIVAPGFAEDCPVACLLSEDPHLSFALATGLFSPQPHVPPGIHPAAQVAPGASVHARAVVEAGAVVETDARVMEGAHIGVGAVVGRGSVIGAFTRLYPHAVIYHGVTLGEQCTVHSHAVLGADGFGFAPTVDGWEKIHQLGALRIGDRVEIGAGTTIDRGTLDDTVIESGVIVDNQVQIGHNCHIGRNTAIAGCVGIAGSAEIGANCTLAGGVGVVGHVKICDNVQVTGMTMVTRSIDRPGSYSSGTPMKGTAQWKRNAARFSRLDDLSRRVRDLERAAAPHNKDNDGD